ncbi:Crp/Fnr family transcriptional regulator [Enterobacter cancerogenus]
MKQKNVVNCAECDFSELCSAYLFVKKDPIFTRNLETKRKIFRGVYLYRRGDKVDAIYALRSGIAKIFDPCGQLMGVVLPGQVMGVEELSEVSCRVDIQAATDIEVCVLSSNHFYEMSQLMPGFTDYLIRILSRSARDKQQFISVLTKRETLHKVQYFLQLLSDIYKEHGFEYRKIKLPVSKKELAELLGISLSTLTRTLEGLAAKGIVVMPNKKEITLLNYEKE